MKKGSLLSLCLLLAFLEMLSDSEMRLSGEYQGG